MQDIKTGNLVKVFHDSYKEETIVLITDDVQHMCNSDGEDWWLEWRGKNVKTDKHFIISSRYHKFEVIN
ncbi:MAG: hypothetical protein EBS86_16830 [Crocinitomicaceae bacterium]|nr:hypothetical protein [Crocinitomicaceae bacterium]